MSEARDDTPATTERADPQPGRVRPAPIDPAPIARPPLDPLAMARRDLAKRHPRRFYAIVSVAGTPDGFGPRLDGRAVRTPAKAPLVVPTHALAEAIAAEWRAVVDVVDPEAMPLTRLTNSAIDGVAAMLDATIAEVAKFAETDLVCYRAADPAALVAAQALAWDPVLAFARATIGARFVTTRAILHVEQPTQARAAVRDALEIIARGPAGALRLAAASVMTSLTGSVLIALAVAAGALTVEVAWAAAHVDEDYQIGIWGQDAEAATRRERRRREMDAAAMLYALAA